MVARVAERVRNPGLANVEFHVAEVHHLPRHKPYSLARFRVQTLLTLSFSLTMALAIVLASVAVGAFLGTSFPQQFS